jgi:hypothetical protein
MAELIFEIWTDDDNGSDEMTAVSAQGDKLRHSVSPNVQCVHSFNARSALKLIKPVTPGMAGGVWNAPEGQTEVISLRKLQRNSAATWQSATSANSPM